MSTWSWRKSSASNGGNNACVELGHRRMSSGDSPYALRDSKNLTRGSLVLSPTAWSNPRSAITC